MKTRFVAALVGFWLLGAAAPAAALEVFYPPNGTSIVRANYLILRLTEGEADAIEIEMGGEKSGRIETAAYRAIFGDFIKMQAAWNPGENQFKVYGFKGGKQTALIEAGIYFVSDPLDSAPSAYEPFVFHQAAREAQCAPCHNMNPTPDQMTDMDPAANPCVGCHKMMFTEKWIHGPAGAFQCGVCHEDGPGESRYEMRQSDFELCFMCHEDKQQEFDSNAFVHGPVGAGMCTLCHDPHASSTIFQVQKPINELCKTCHEGFNKIHVLRAPSGNPHPMEGRKDPAREGRELACSSCHNPHGNNVRYFWRDNPPSKMTLCLRCHKK